VQEIDFLMGNDAYKQDWMSERRECFALSCVQQEQPAGRLASLTESLRDALKRVTASNH
jgi:hypothetical protein